MAAVGDNYILKGQSDHDRLRMISEIHDGATRELLRHAGFAKGCRYVEFGCGLGYVTRWAAAEGAVATGIDANEEQVKACREIARSEGIAQVEFRAGNIYEPDLDPDSVDVAYCRWLMVHLNRPVDAMGAIFKALKPGGVMVCEEAGVGAVYAEPRSAGYEEMRDICLQAGRARGVDYDGGRYAHTVGKTSRVRIDSCRGLPPALLERSA
jgi:SAM-dependent methyltransferase